MSKTLDYLWVVFRGGATNFLEDGWKPSKMLGTMVDDEENLGYGTAKTETSGHYSMGIHLPLPIFFAHITVLPTLTDDWDIIRTA